ncbi:hypothetical protein ACFX2H_029820 [Malus domestica]
MHRGAKEYVQRCDSCYRFKPVPALPANKLHPQTSPCPFMQLVIDLAGPISPPTEGKDMMIVATDYFTKWGNGQAEVSNKTILDCLKKSLSDKKGKWPDNLPGVLWAYHTTKKRVTSETPFFLAYGNEVIILPNVMVPSISTVLPNFEQNKNEMATNLDSVEEEREKVITHIVAYQHQFLSN